MRPPAVTGVALYLPFSVFVVLGQDYLPNRIGTASGVTVGLAVSVGGLAAPALGVLADATSLRTVFALLVLLPIIALALSTLLHNPTNQSHSGTAPPIPTTSTTRTRATP